MKRMNKVHAAAALLLLSSIFLPAISYAHVKWFTTEAPIKESLEKIMSPLFMITAVLTAVLLAVLAQLLTWFDRIPVIETINAKLDQLRGHSRDILKYGTAVALVIQAFSGSLLSPELPIDSTIIKGILWLTAFLLFIPFPWATKLGAILGLGLFAYEVTQVGIFHMLDYGFYVAIFAVLLISRTEYQDWGFPFLYLGTGLSLCWVAVEKWVYPNMTIDIIQNHQVPTFGFQPEVFIVLSAFIEFVVGYALVVGILNRVFSVVLTVVFILTTMLFGATEVIGHFIIHIVLVIFIIEGTSFYKPPIQLHQHRGSQMVFVFLNFLFALAIFLLLYYRFG